MFGSAELFDFFCKVQSTELGIPPLSQSRAILAEEEALLLSSAVSRALVVPRFSMIFNRLILATGAAGPLLHLHTMSTGVHVPQIQCCAI